MTRRLIVYLAWTFGLTASAWGTLALLPVSRPIFLLLYATGGLGPTIAALLTSRTAEFGVALRRFRVKPAWYALAIALPLGLTVAAARALEPVIAAPVYLFIPALAAGILGGGLEELGWRGIAQPEFERTMPRPVAAVIVGVLWALWHLPLFAIPGVPQYGRNYPLFAAALIGDAQLLAWLRERTQSIPLCVLFHAAGNAAWFVVIGNLSGRIQDVALATAVIRLIAGTLAAFHQGSGAGGPAHRP